MRYEIMHFQTWHDKAKMRPRSRSGRSGERDTVDFPIQQFQRKRESQKNLIMPENPRVS